MAEGRQGPLPAFPWLRWNQGQCRPWCTLQACTVSDSWHHGAHSGVSRSGRGILGGSSPSRRVPIPPTLYCSSQMQRRDRSGGFCSNTQGVDLVPDRAVTTTEQRGGPAQYPVQVLITTTPFTPPIKGVGNSQHTLRKEQQASTLKAVLKPEKH